MKILIVDNYDSFTYNLYHYFRQLASEVVVKRNDAISIKEAAAFSHLVISPGPGLPSQAGISMELIRSFHRSKPILGVCLGCQAIAGFYGASLYNQNLVAHGIKRKILAQTDQSWLLKGLPSVFDVGLYHSWAVNDAMLPSEWQVSARSEKGTLMAMEHRNLALAGVQFHPESIMSEHGLQMLENWLEHSKKV